METISSKSSNLLASLGCLLPSIGIFILINFILNKSGFVGFLIAAVLFFIGLLIFGQVHTIETRRKIEQKDALLSFKADQIDFQKMHSITSSDLLSRVAIDYNEQRIYLWSAQDENGKMVKKPKFGMSYRLFNYSFSDIEAIAMLEDGYIISSAFRSSETSRDALENFIKKDVIRNAEVLLKERPIDRVNAMELIIQVDNEIHPFYQIRFYNDPYKKIGKDAPEYHTFFSEMQQWFNKLALIANDTNRKPHPILTNQQNMISRKDKELTETNTQIYSDPLEKKNEPLENSTHVLLEVEQQTYSLDLIQVDKQIPFKETEIEKSPSSVEEGLTIKKELTYFEKLIAENKRQLTDSTPKKK